MKTPDTSYAHIIAQAHEVGFLKGLRHAAKIAQAKGDLQTAIAIGAVSFNPAQTFALANKSRETENV